MAMANQPVHVISTDHASEHLPQMPRHALERNNGAKPRAQPISGIGPRLSAYLLAGLCLRFGLSSLAWWAAMRRSICTGQLLHRCVSRLSAPNARVAAGEIGASLVERNGDGGQGRPPRRRRLVPSFGVACSAVRLAGLLPVVESTHGARGCGGGRERGGGLAPPMGGRAIPMVRCPRVWGGGEGRTVSAFLRVRWGPHTEYGLRGRRAPPHIGCALSRKSALVKRNGGCGDAGNYAPVEGQQLCNLIVHTPTLPHHSHPHARTHLSHTGPYSNK